MFLICEFKVAPAQCFEFHPFRSPAMPKTMEEPKSMKRPKRAKTARREMTPEQKKARNEARRGTRSTEVEHRRTKQKGKRGVETQRRQASEQARQYTFSQYWYEQGRTVGKRVTKPDILAQNSWKEGYKAGYKAGHKKGVADGKTKGVSEAWSEARNCIAKEAEHNGFKQGRISAFSDFWHCQLNMNKYEQFRAEARTSLIKGGVLAPTRADLASDANVIGARRRVTRPHSKM